MTMIELILYVAILLVLAFVAVSSLIALSGAYRTMKSAQSIDTAGSLSLERMVREVRDATSVDTSQSTLGSSPGSLVLNTTDASGATTSVQFFVSGQSIHVKEAGVDKGPLTPASVRVTNLVFRQISTANSKAVKIELTLESGQAAYYRSKSFYSTVVLRGSYPVQ